MGALVGIYKDQDNSPMNTLERRTNVTDVRYCWCPEPGHNINS